NARIVGQPYFQVQAKAGIDEPQGLIRKSLDEAAGLNAHRVTAAVSYDEEPSGRGSAAPESAEAHRKREQLTGASYMVASLAGGAHISDYSEDVDLGNSLWNLPTEYGDLALGPVGAYLGAVAFQIGNLSMGFLVASLAGYIAFGIADRPGIAPGFTVGAVAV